MPSVFFVDNDGGGFADTVHVDNGTTVEAFFARRMEGRSATDYLIRVNREVANASLVLQEGDRITITPTKVQGAG